MLAGNFFPYYSLWKQQQNQFLTLFFPFARRRGRRRGSSTFRGIIISLPRATCPACNPAAASWPSFREDISGVAQEGTPISGLTSGHLDFWPSGLLAISIWTSGLTDYWPQNLWPSGLLDIRFLAIKTSGRPSVLLYFFFILYWIMSQCPDLDIFRLLPCRLHQSQIPNVLPDHHHEVFGRNGPGT